MIEPKSGSQQQHYSWVLWRGCSSDEDLSIFAVEVGMLILMYKVCVEKACLASVECGLPPPMVNRFGHHNLGVWLGHLAKFREKDFHTIFFWKNVTT
jgi:hypothetical protein